MITTVLAGAQKVTSAIDLAADPAARAITPLLETQHVRVPAEPMAAKLVGRLAANVIDLDRQLAVLDRHIADRLSRRLRW